MNWRAFWSALTVASLFAVFVGAATPAYAGVNKAALLAAIAADESVAQGYVLQVGKMHNLGPAGRPILNDVNAASLSLAQLYKKTLADTSATALAADAARYSFLDGALKSLEGPKVGLASLANDAAAEYISHKGFLRTMVLAGGLYPKSPFHNQTVALTRYMSTAHTNLMQAIALLDQANLAKYPGSLSLLVPAQAAIDKTNAALAIVDQLVVQDASLVKAAEVRYADRDRVHRYLIRLQELRTRVMDDPHLTSDERANLLGQINADLDALGQLNQFLIGAADLSGLDAELLALLNEPGVFILIAPKADIMEAGAADRAAIQRLNGLVPTLQSRIDQAAAKHRDISHLKAKLSDLLIQLAGANADIAPIDSEFENMKAITASQRSHDAQVIQAALAALGDANARLATARNDANEILAATTG